MGENEIKARQVAEEVEQDPETGKAVLWGLNTFGEYAPKSLIDVKLTALKEDITVYQAVSRLREKHKKPNYYQTGWSSH